MTRLLAAVRREPVRAYLYGLTVPGAALAVAYGLTSADKAVLWVGLAAAVLVPGGVELARRKTTPVADPRTRDGKPAYLEHDRPPPPAEWLG